MSEWGAMKGILTWLFPSAEHTTVCEQLAEWLNSRVNEATVFLFVGLRIRRP
jgi:hypothetical protein